MLRTALLVGAASFSMFARDPGCGDVESQSASGINAPCERTSDCANGLTCADGVCVNPSEDAGDEGGAKDAGGNG